MGIFSERSNAKTGRKQEMTVRIPIVILRRCMVINDSQRPPIWRRWSASRIERLTIVKVGFATPDVGNTELLATYKLSIPCTRQFWSTTPWHAQAAILVVPKW